LARNAADFFLGAEGSSLLDGGDAGMKVKWAANGKKVGAANGPI